MRGNGKHQAADVKAEHEDNRGSSQHAVNRLFANPKTKKATRPLDAKFGFPILKEPWLDLDEAGPKQNHQKPPARLVAEAVVGDKPLREPIAHASHRQQVGGGPKEKQRISRQQRPERAAQIAGRGGVVAESADDRSPAGNAFRTVAGKGEE